MPIYDGRYDRELRMFTDAMRAKMAANVHKGRWEGIELTKALESLREEVGELEEAIERGNVTEILLEGADCGVWALIITTIAIESALKGDGSAKKSEPEDRHVVDVEVFDLPRLKRRGKRKQKVKTKRRAKNWKPGPL